MDENGEAFAVIEGADKVQKLFRKGDDVAGMTLSAVHRDRAVLESGGKSLELAMEPPAPGARPVSFHGHGVRHGYGHYRRTASASP